MELREGWTVQRRGWQSGQSLPEDLVIHKTYAQMMECKSQDDRGWCVRGLELSHEHADNF